ncbi:serine/threonine protein kinase [Cellulosilyticum ruminicola]|uniref:serine/threonine protein kinase n=1 Tax=Cellulosilyticum ruminicola TaxID=425254 RepID=UPI0006CF2EF8|nr:protein kinase family protein [Cellulosilyticum ruminicola]
MDRYYKPGTQIKDFTITKILGQGRYGIAYLGENRYGKKCVIKQLKKNMLRTTRNKLFYEQDILKSLHSSSIPKFMGTFKNRDAEGYILEYIDGTPLDVLVRKKGYRFSRKEIYNIGSQLLRIIETLQASQIVHRDIRLPNVIMRPNGKLALIDFGLARYIDDEKYTVNDDYWYLGDFLIRLYYTSYFIESDSPSVPWYYELSLTREERYFLKKLLGINGSFESLSDIKANLKELKSMT